MAQILNQGLISGEAMTARSSSRYSDRNLCIGETHLGLEFCFAHNGIMPSTKSDEEEEVEVRLAPSTQGE